MSYGNLFLIFCLTLMGKYFAQSASDIELPKLIPPSPEATSIAKLSEIPVSHYTGIPDINSPLHTINVGGLSIQVGLSYHARGIKVEEIASRVGLGWSLNYGGMITRQIRGKADDGLNGYLRKNFYSTFFTNESTRSAVYIDDMNKEVDLIPDQFYFDINGQSGKFVFDQKDKQPVIQDYEDIQITPLYSNSIIVGWKVIDQQGNTYYFGKSKDGQRSAKDMEYTLINNRYSAAGLESLPNEGSSHFNSWQLMEIETPKKQVISFFYEVENPEFYKRSYDIQTPGQGVTSYFSKVRSEQNQLKKIVFPGGSLVFTKAGIQREELNKGYALEKVELLNTTEGVVKEYLLDYNYVSSPSSNNYLFWFDNLEPKANKRMYLTSITQQAGGMTLRPETFYYSSQPLPNRFSNSQDSWGYFNGKPNGQFLTMHNYGNTIVSREVDTIKSGAGLLNKIIHKTGGSTSFVYEQNSAIPPAYMADFFISNNNPVISKSEGMVKDPLFYSNGVYSKIITIGQNLVGQLRTNISFTEPAECSTTQNTTTCNYQVRLEGANTYNLYMGKNTVYITPGTYVFKVIPKTYSDPYDWSNNNFMASLHWEEQEISDNELIYASGKRIKKINYETNGSAVKTKEYKYLKTDGTPSGKIFGLPNFYFIKEVVNGIPVIDKYGSRAGSPLTSLQGNSVGYTNVREYQGSVTNNIGKTEYQFTAFEDAGEYYKFPYHPPMDNEWLRGKPVSQKVYVNENGSYQLKKAIEYQYLYGNIINPGGPVHMMYPLLPPTQTNPYLKNRTQFLLPLIHFSSENGTSSHNNYKTFYLNGGTADLLSTVETIYDGPNPMITSTNYGFNYNKHYQTNYFRTSTSDLDPIIKIIVYPHDILNPSHAEGKLKLDNRLVPIEIKEYKDYNNDNLPGSTEILSTTNNNYQTVNGLTEIARISVAKKAETPKDRITYHRYDSSGNPLEVSQVDGPRTVYLWGYNDRYPIAKIENATYAEVANAIIQGGLPLLL